MSPEDQATWARDVERDQRRRQAWDAYMQECAAEDAKHTALRRERATGVFWDATAARWAAWQDGELLGRRDLEDEARSLLEGRAVEA